MKKSFVVIPLLSSLVLGLGCTIASTNFAQKKAIVVNAETEASAIDLTTIPFSNTPQSGWGNINVNKTCTGDSIVVNGVTYEKGFGLHVHNDPAVTLADMEFDISELSDKYEFFEASVAQPETGNNCIKFTVLVDGVEKDFIYWRKSYGDGNPYVVRCSIKGGSKLTLRTQCTNWGYADGTSVWVNPRLFNAADTTERVQASYLLKRTLTTTGWGAYLTGEISYPYSLFDQRVNGTSFSVFAPYGDPCQYTNGIGTQLKGSTYEAYSANKSDTNLYTSLKFDVEGRNLDFFNTVASMGAGGGCYLDAWVDGVEVYHHPNLVSAANAGEVINVPLAKDAKEFELRIVPANGIGDGLVDLLGSQFFKTSNYLYSMNGVDSLAPEYRWPVTRNTANNGRALKVRDSESATDVLAQKGLMLHQNGSYLFNVEGTEYDVLSGKIGASSDEQSHGANRLKVTFTYKNGTSYSETSDEFSYANSNIDFSFVFYPNNLETIKLELIGTLANSKSVLNAPKLTCEHEALTVLVRDKLKMETYTEDKGWCADTEHHYYADAKQWLNEEVSNAEKDLFFNTTTNTVFINARERLLHWAYANGDVLNASNNLTQRSSIFSIIGENESNNIAIIAIILTVATGCAILICIKKRKVNH